MNRESCYKEIKQQACALFGKEDDLIARMANLSALLYRGIPNVNWAGFYRKIDYQLILGPFQGKPACTPIAIGKGVCGCCAETLQIQCVANVHEYPGHIACDAESKSEIVLPIIIKDTLLGVLDIDSDVYGNFDKVDIDHLKEIIDIMLHHNTCENR